MEDEPESKATRFLFNNCQSLDFNYKDNNYMKSKLQTYLSTGAHYVAFAETGINIYKSGNLQKVNDMANEVLQEGMITMHHSKSIGEADFQWGGIGTMMYGRIHNRWMSNEKEKHGRWIMQKFFGEKKNLCVYTLYRVNQGDTTKGGSTSAWNQQRYSLDLEGTKIDPRKQVIAALLKDVQKKIKEGNSIIIMADLNEGLESKEKTNEKLEQIGLVNIMAEKIGGTLPNTHRNGSHAIDHAWASGDVCAHITRAGISPFNYPAYSDHRSLVFDIDMKQILDADYMFLSSFMGRALKMSMPERVEKYGEEIDKQWEYHKMEEKYDRLQKLFRKRGAIKSNIKKLNKWDKQLTEIMLSAEKKCSRIGRKPTIPWSPKVHEAVQKIYEAGYNRRKARQRLVSGDNESSQIYKNAKEEYKAAKMKYKQIRKDASDLREEFLNKRIELLQEQRREFRDKGKIKILKILKHREKQRDQARRINYVLLKKKKAGISSLLIPSKEEYDDDNADILHIPTIWLRLQRANGKDVRKWTRITDRATMETLLIQWQRFHFAQANETPLSTAEWCDRLGSESVQDQILEGKFIMEEKYPKECKLLFSCMKKETKVKKEVNCDTTYREFLSYINKADETTSASPSGRTYSHYKALASESASILKYIHGLFCLALKYKVVLDRWSTTITTLILKDDEPTIHRMRTIHIVEVELQFITKITYAQRMMRSAELSKDITDEQYGGRRGRQALSVVVNKLLYYSITRQTLSNAAFMDDDARACYDRIMPHLAEVETQKWGVSRETAKITTAILKSQEFHIRTGHGIANTTYTNHDEIRTQGAGQGLGWSGPLWTCSSDTISKGMNQTCAGMTFRSYDKKYEVSKCGDFFVDDTATGVTENNVRKTLTMLQELEHLEQTHANLMYAEGHRMAFDKCNYYLVEFSRHKLGHRYKTKEDLPGELYLSEGFQHEKKKIRRLDPNEAHKTLGHYLAVDGNYSVQQQQIKLKLTYWNKCIAASGLDNETKRLAYNGWLLPAIKYKILSCNMTYEECERLQQIINPTLFRAHGIAKTCSKVVLHSSHRLAGLNVWHLYQLQGMEKLKYFLWHYRRSDTTGQLLKISIGYTQLELGLPTQFFQLKHSEYSKLITETWVTSIWSYLEACKTRLDLLDHSEYKLPREGDMHFMEVLFAHKLDITKLVKINQIRLKLKVLSLSDIVEIGSKTKVLQRVKNGVTSRKSEWGWPQIKMIPEAWYKEWRNVLSTIIEPFLRVHPLGRWKHDSHQQWDAMITSSREHLFYEDNYFIYNINNNRYTPFFTQEHPKCEYPADIDPETMQLISDGRKISVTSAKPHDERTTYREIVNELPYWERRNLGSKIPDDSTWEEVATVFREGNFLAISDGSYKDGRASHAWCITNSKEKRRLMLSAGPVDGPRTELSAFRAEAMGLLAVFTVIKVLEMKGNTTQHKVRIQLDCKGLITKLKSVKIESISSIEENDIDVLYEIRSRLDETASAICVEHVKGHQDKNIQYENLPFSAKINCDVDAQAKLFLQTPPKHLIPTETYPILPGQKISILVRGKLTVHELRSVLNDSWIHRRWEAYLGSVLKIKKEDIARINILPLTKHLRENRQALGSIAKIIHQQLNTFETCKRWNTAPEAICPLCKLEVETHRHILMCTFPPLQQSRKSSLNHIAASLGQNNTEPNLRLFLQQAIQSFAVDHPVAKPKLSMNPLDIQLTRIHRSQTSIGWNNFFRGYISIHIEEMQRNYLEAKGDATPYLSAQRWSRKLANLLIQHYRTAWRHRCDALALINDETLEKRRREKACEKLQLLLKKWWLLMPADRYLLNRDEDWLRKAKFINVQMWLNEIALAENRADHLRETRGNDIRNYLQKEDMGNQDILSIVPVQVSHRKSKYDRIKQNGKLRFGPKGVTRVAVAPLRTLKQCKLNLVSRTSTARDTHVKGSHVK